MRLSPLLTAAAVSALAALVTFGFAQASAETRSYPLSNFDAIDASAGIRVILKQGPYAVSVEEPDGRFDALKMNVDGHKLFIGRQPNMGEKRGRGPRFTVTVTAPAYTGVAASSGSRVEADALSAKQLEAVVSSGAHAELKGSCTQLSANASSGARFDGETLKCETATVAASSGASAVAFASRTATANASSGAHVTLAWASLRCGNFWPQPKPRPRPACWLVPWWRPRSALCGRNEPN
jgi:hypothetical protein